MCRLSLLPPWQWLSADRRGDVLSGRRKLVFWRGGWKVTRQAEWPVVSSGCQDAWPPTAPDMTERMAECQLNCSACHVCHARRYRKSCFLSGAVEALFIFYLLEERKWRTPFFILIPFSIRHHNPQSSLLSPGWSFLAGFSAVHTKGFIGWRWCLTEATTLPCSVFYISQAITVS